MHALAYQNKNISRRQMEIIPAGGYTADDIRVETLSGRYQVIFVDYLQLVRTERKNQNRTEEVGSVSRTLHTLAQQHGVTVIALAQLNRPDKGTLRAPRLSDLRESGQIEQDADVVMMLSLIREWDTNEPKNSTDRLLQIVKNKEGELNYMRLAFDGRAQQLVERMQPDNRKGARRAPSPLGPVSEPDPDPQMKMES